MRIAPPMCTLHYLSWTHVSLVGGVLARGMVVMVAGCSRGSKKWWGAQQGSARREVQGCLGLGCRWAGGLAGRLLLLHVLVRILPKRRGLPLHAHVL